MNLNKNALRTQFDEVIYLFSFSYACTSLQQNSWKRKQTSFFILKCLVKITDVSELLSHCKH